MSITWEQHYREFPETEAAALRQHLCFCKCGCRAEGVEPIKNLLGKLVPGLCDECKSAAKTKKGRALHERAREPAMTWREPEPTPTLKQRVARLFKASVSDLQRDEATDWIRRNGAEGTVFMQSMYDRVLAGKVLTDVQVQAVRRARGAAKRDAGFAAKRLAREYAKIAKDVDLTRIRVTAPDGKYAVESDTGDYIIVDISRPTKPPLNGFVVVKMDVGEGLTKYGVQYPQPYRDVEKHPQTYRGHYPQLVAKVMADPDKAAETYNQLWGKPK